MSERYLEVINTKNQDYIDEDYNLDLYECEGKELTEKIYNIIKNRLDNYKSVEMPYLLRVKLLERLEVCYKKQERMRQLEDEPEPEEEEEEESEPYCCINCCDEFNQEYIYENQYCEECYIKMYPNLDIGKE